MLHCRLKKFDQRKCNFGLHSNCLDTQPLTAEKVKPPYLTRTQCFSFSQSPEHISSLPRVSVFSISSAKVHEVPSPMLDICQDNDSAKLMFIHSTSCSIWNTQDLCKTIQFGMVPTPVIRTTKGSTWFLPTMFAHVGVHLHKDKRKTCFSSSRQGAVK